MSDSFCLPLISSWGFPCDSGGKEFACNLGDLGSIPELGRAPGEGKDYPLQYSGLEKDLKESDTTFTHHFMANRWGNDGISKRLYFLGLQNHCRW